MNVEVKLFAAARELAGADSLQAELPAGATVGDLRAWLTEHVPDLAPLLATATFAVDADYASDATALPDGAEVACIPPVSGG